MVKWDFSLAAGALGLSMSVREIWDWGTWRGFALACVSGTLRIAFVLAAVWPLRQVPTLQFLGERHVISQKRQGQHHRWDYMANAASRSATGTMSGSSSPWAS
jgi:hypothetical protein